MTYFDFMNRSMLPLKRISLGLPNGTMRMCFLKFGFYIFKIDNRAKITAAAAGTVPNKMAQEADARKAYIYILIKFHLPTGCFIQININ